MKKTKGFTLIELLAVIVILAIIALIATPLVLNVINEAKLGSFKASIYGIIKAIENGYASDILNGENKNEIVIYTYQSGIETSSVEGKKINYKGQKPKSGNIIVDKEGQITLSLHNGTWCATKEINEETITIVKKEEEECITPIPLPTIELIGSDNINVEINEFYNELGYKAYGVAGNELTSLVKVEVKQGETILESIITSQVTSYRVIYSIEEDGKYVEVIRIVNIVDTIAPVLTIPADITIRDIDIPIFNMLEGVSVTDNSGQIPDITIIGNISELPGEYELTYKASDNSGNETSKTRKVIITETPTLVITTSGAATTPFLNGPMNKNEINSIEFVTTKVIPDGVLGSWDVSKRQNQNVMAWYKHSQIKGLYDVYIGGNGQVYGNEDSKYLFSNLTSLVNINLTNFNTSKVTDMTRMFSGVSSLTNLNLSSFDTSNVISTDYMFAQMSGLTSLNISTFDTSKVKSMAGMFYEVSNLVNLDLSSFDTSNVTNMSTMFSYMSSLSNLNISSFRTPNVTNMFNMFSNMSSLVSLNLSYFDTSNVTNMSYMFAEMSSLTNLNVNNFNTSNVTNMGSMFLRISNLTSLNVSSFDTSKVTNMSSMFSGMSKLVDLNVNNFNTSKVTAMGAMFSGMSSLTTLNLKNAEFGSITSYTNMFTGVKNGITVYTKNETTKSWLQGRLTDAGKTGTVTIVS